MNRTLVLKAYIRGGGGTEHSSDKTR